MLIRFHHTAIIKKQDFKETPTAYQSEFGFLDLY